MQMRTLSRYITLVPLFVFGGAVAQVTEQNDAEFQAERILDLMSDGKFAEMWDCCVSADVKGIMTKSAFIAQMSIGRGPMGPMTAEKNMINSAFATAAPSVTGSNTPKMGRFYSFTYETTYATVMYYEAISVVKDDGVFKFWGINGAPRK
jgi:hypothetical protein